ncbi:MAG: haloacid dehalogenase, partial [Rhodobacterales bacterium]|nr:haloacid dehalogenase [Rhodobacterales bacterium]
AAGFGFETAWVNRSKDPIDRLPNKPAHIFENLEAIPSFFDK